MAQGSEGQSCSEGDADGKRYESVVRRNTVQENKRA